ncbi:MAG: hypothetical protein QOI96_1143 [Verrucomicrobiota bacterium]
MKRILLLIVIGAVASLAILYGIRMAERSAGPSVSTLLPRETILFGHLPNLNRARDQWHQSDIYQLYLETSVQEFLRKPLAKLPQKDAAARTLKDFAQLDPKDAFVAITKIDDNNPTLVGGFRYRGSAEAAGNLVIGPWLSQVVKTSPTAKRETIHYEHHDIDVITVAPFTLATAFDGDWFFAANDLTELKAIIYRADHRGQDRQSTLDGDKNFHAAMAHMPTAYAISFYLQPKIFADKLAWLRSADGRNVPPDQRTMLEQVRSMCGTTRFEHGKIHDTFFVGMPKLQEGKLSRSSLALGTKDTLIYLATLLNLGQKLDALSQVTGSAAVAAGWQRTLQALARSGVTAEDWKAAFGVELGALADWPATARAPWLFVSFSVQDAARAGQIVEALTRMDEDSIWNQTEKDNVRYFSMTSPASLFAISPTIALSNRIMIVGLDPISVEQAIKRSESDTSELGNSAAYSGAAKSVPAPTNFFAYVDLPLFYSRVDATLRPMLFLGAAFLPWLNDYVDLSKLPPAEVVTKHLSPIVSSQRYDGDGYAAESVGSITLGQSGAALGALAIFGSMGYPRGSSPSLNNLIAPPSSPPPATPSGRKGNASPSPKPSGTP